MGGSANQVGGVKKPLRWLLEAINSSANTMGGSANYIGGIENSMGGTMEWPPDARNRLLEVPRPVMHSRMGHPGAKVPDQWLPVPSS